MLRRAFLLFCILTLAQTAVRASEADLERLDSFVARRSQYVAVKQRHIDTLVARLHRARTDVERLHAYNRLFEAYYTFRFDSAMVYVKRGLQLAERANNAVFIDNFRIHRGLLLATGAITARRWPSCSASMWRRSTPRCVSTTITQWPGSTTFGLPTATTTSLRLSWHGCAFTTLGKP